MTWQAPAEAEPSPPQSGSFSAGRLRLACASLCPGRSRTIPLAVGVLVCRPPAAACADRRSAFPCPRVALPRPKPNHPPAVGVLVCRPPAAACADRRSAFPCPRVALPRAKPNHPPASPAAACADQRSAVPARRSAGRLPAACADRRSAFPCPRVALPRPKPNHPPRSRGPCLPAACGGLCRPEVGVPLPARRSAPGEAEPSPRSGVLVCRPPAAACADQRSAFPCPRGAEPSPSQSGSLSAGRLRRPVPTGGRRSPLPRVALPRARNLGRWRVGQGFEPAEDEFSRPKPNHPPRSRGPCLPAACGGLCRPEVGVPLPARRSAPGEAEPSPPQSGSLSAGRLRRPVPTRGRRSRACASLCSGRSRTIPPAVGVLLCRPPAAACADRRSAFPCPRVALLRAKPNHPRAQKTMAANSVRCRRDRGESVKGGHPPFHKKTTRIRNSPPRAGGAQGSSESGAQRLAVRKGGKTPENTDFRDLSRLKPPLRTARPGAWFCRRRPSGGCRCA